jgi:hypothetical protein
VTAPLVHSPVPAREGLALLFRQLVSHQNTTGVLNLKGLNSSGALFVENGRVCWAAAAETRRYLRSQLLAAGIDSRLLESRLAEADVKRVPLGELLVSQGVLSAPALRSAILEHSLESLRAVLSKTLLEVTFSPRPTKSFDPMFTFDGVELLGEAARRLCLVPTESREDPPREGLDGFVMVGEGDAAFPVARLGEGLLSLGNADALGRRALRVLSAAPCDVAERAVSFRTQEASWSVSGSPRFFAVSVSNCAFGFSWMLTRGASQRC